MTKIIETIESPSVFNLITTLPKEKVSSER